MNVNEAYGATFGSIDAPMGGMKYSGLGRRQGPEGMLRFVEPQAIGTQSLIPLAPSFGISPQAFASGVTGRPAGAEGRRPTLRICRTRTKPETKFGQMDICSHTA